MGAVGLFDSEEPVDLLPSGNARATYVPDFLGDGADGLLEHLTSSLRWDQPSIRMYGKSSLLPREVAWVADSGVAYRYSGVASTPQGWTPHLLDLRTRLEEHTGAVFNSVLVNRYRDGRDTVAWHSDDEPELGPAPTIASISLGAERRFQLRHKEHRDTVEVRLAHGSLLVMAGTCQREWVHQVPREAKIKGPRINLTFRHVLPR